MSLEDRVERLMIQKVLVEKQKVWKWYKEWFSIKWSLIE